MNFLKPGVALGAVVFASPVLADSSVRYEVTITNITKGQTFTPQLVAGHRSSVSLFTLGEPASEELAILAEGGDTGPLTDALLGHGNAVKDVTTIGALLGPGETASVEIEGPRHRGHLSVAAMLIPTNDTFMALNGVPLPRFGTAVFHAVAYDAGSEANDQNCAHIPGPPPCFGEPVSAPADSDEGYVYVSNGFHELGALDEDGNVILGPATYDWRNPVARITVHRVR